MSIRFPGKRHEIRDTFEKNPWFPLVPLHSDCNSFSLKKVGGILHARAVNSLFPIFSFFRTFYIRISAQCFLREINVCVRKKSQRIFHRCQCLIQWLIIGGLRLSLSISTHYSGPPQRSGPAKKEFCFFFFCQTRGCAPYFFPGERVLLFPPSIRVKKSSSGRNAVARRKEGG